MALHWQIMIAIGAAFVFGSLFGTEIDGFSLLSIYEFVGGMFLDALKMLIVPLIMSSIISGAANLGQGKGVVAIAGRTVTYFLVSTALAIVTALVVVNVIQPGVSGQHPLSEVVHLPSLGGDISAKFASHQFSDFVQVVRDMVPANIVDAAAHTQMLGLIVFSLLFGFALTRIPEPGRQVVHDFWNGVQEVMIQITHWLMKLAPIGVFALVAAVVAKSGLALLLPMLGFFLTVTLGQFVGRHAARDHGCRGKPGRRVEGNRFVRPAAWRDHQHERHRVVRMRSRVVHRSGLWGGSVDLDTVDDCGAGPDDLDRGGCRAFCQSGGHCPDSGRTGPTAGSDGAATGRGSGAGHAAHLGECLFRFGRRRDCGAPAR
jgi:hypothetical protein